MGSDLGSSSSADCANLSLGFAHGDLIIQSVDGGKFHVHSTLLSLASPVFEDMFSIGLRQSGEIVEMAETSEMLSLMLQFIYPKRSPIIPSFDVLEKAFHIADKYQLEGMYQQLRERLSLADSPVSAYSDPLGALRVASAHGFCEEVDLAISLTQKHYRLDTIDHLLEIADRTPASTPWIKLLAVPLIRNRVLSDVLLNFYDPPMRLAGSSFTRALCQPCSESHHYGAHNSPPEWLARWARGVLEKLKDRPIDQWEHYFGTKFLHEAVSQYDMPIRTPRGDCTCVEKVKFYEYEFLGWSSHVLECLKSRLKCLEQLETLR